MPGFAEIIKASADPAVGGEIVYTADENMIVHSCVVTLVTSAVAANRQAQLLADDGNAANVFYRAGTQTAITASQTGTVSGVEGIPLQSFGGLSLISLPSMGLRLRKGDRLRTLTSGLDAGDNYGVMTIQAERQ